MEGLAAYSDSEDEEDRESLKKLEPAASKVDMPAKEMSSKVLSIAFLPPEIQAGLRGELEDSDDDGFETQKGGAVKEDSGKTGNANEGVVSGLLKILPNPKNPPPVHSAPTISPAPAAPSRTSLFKHEREDDDEDVEEEVDSNLLFNTSFKSRQALGGLTGATANTTASADLHVYHRAAFAQQQQQQQRGEVHQQHQQPKYGVTNAPAMINGNSHSNCDTNKRKRDRELEQQLLSGNISALDQADGVTRKDMRIDGQTWSKEQYYARKEEEAKIRKEFNVTEGSLHITGAAGTKQQKSKHQLSTLAAQAVRDKMNLVEKKKVEKASMEERRTKYGF